MMRHLMAFAKLPRSEKRLFGSALRLSLAARVGLWLLPFRRVQVWMLRLGQPQSGRSAAPVSEEAILRAVQRAGRCVPRSTCLTRALAARALLRRHGYEVRLQIGAARGAEGKYEAHAWIEEAGRILMGGDDSARFTPLLSVQNNAVLDGKESC